MYIGKRVRELRKAKKMSLSDLAEKSTVQIATLSRIEHLRMTGTLDSHLKIARALEVDVTDLYHYIMTDKEKKALQKVERSNKRGAKPLEDEKEPTNVFVHSDKSSYEILTKNLLTKRMMPMILRVDPNGKTNNEENKIGTEKFVYILEGELQINVNGEEFTVPTGTSLYFDASKKHFMENKGKTTVRAIVIASPVVL